VWDLDLHAHSFQQTYFGLEPENRLIMTVAVNQGFAAQLWRIVSCFIHQELAEGESLGAEALCVRIVGEQALHFVAKNADATWFEADHRNAGGDLRLQGCQYLA